MTTATRANVAGLLPLLPNQQALLLARGLHREDPGLIHVTFTLRGGLDVDRYLAAWRAVIRRHPALRASIRAREGGDPMVVIWHDVELPVEVLDWRALDGATRAQRWDRLLVADRRLGLDPAAEPVMRLRVVRVADGAFEVLWSSHHLFVDGWSAAIVLEDVMARYRGGQATDAGPAPPDALRAYVRWMQGADDAAARDFWRERLAGYDGAPRLTLGDPDPAAAGYGELTVQIPAELAERLGAAAAHAGVTANAFVQCAWSLLLARLLRTDDVVFGTTVAGRAAPVAGIERLVGFLSNAVPIRMRLDPAQPVAELLGSARDAQFAMQPFEHAPLASIHGWSGVPGSRAMFETFLMVANYRFAAADPPAGADPPANGGAPPDGSVAHSDFDSGLTATFPFVVAVALGVLTFVRCRFELARCTPEAAELVAAQLLDTIRAMIDAPGATVGELHARSGDHLDGVVTRAGDEPAPAARRAPTPPGDDVELRMAQLWEEVLGIEGIGVHDDYFTLGGTSITAVRLFGLIEDRFGQRLPLSTLLTGATIADLAKLLRGGEPPRPAVRALVPIQPKGSQPPIACLHPNTGHVLFYRTLAERLGPDQPLYGFEPVGLDGVAEPLETVAEMAALYVDELRTVQPRGPYRLVGHCFGGVLALEMARLLEARGEPIDLLAVLDPPRLQTDAARERAARIWRERGVMALPGAATRRLVHVARRELRKTVVRWWGQAFGGAGGRQRANQERIRDVCDRALATYEAVPCSTPITLITSTEENRWSAGIVADWRALTPELQLGRVDSGHGSMLDEPAVGAVAAIIVSSLSMPSAGQSRER